MIDEFLKRLGWLGRAECVSNITPHRNCFAVYAHVGEQNFNFVSSGFFFKLILVPLPTDADGTLYYRLACVPAGSRSPMATASALALRYALGTVYMLQALARNGKRR